jgi:hypothetical protein
MLLQVQRWPRESYESDAICSKLCPSTIHHPPTLYLAWKNKCKKDHTHHWTGQSGDVCVGERVDENESMVFSGQ